MKTRLATHSGSWYSSSPSRLKSQIDSFLELATESSVSGARVLVGPHAGYSYAGETLAETYKAWDTTGVKRVFIMGPSHHVYFRGHVKLSGYDVYETPLGDVPVDSECVKDLVASDPGLFELMTEEEDDDEHSFEMHMPYLYSMTAGKVPAIVPIMVSHSDETLERRLATVLAPYFADKSNTFVVSTDFCHWGDRFGYMLYTSGDPYKLSNIGHSLDMPPNSLPIYKSIEILDKHAMEIMARVEYKEWKRYLKLTQNTICGARPLSVLMLLMQDSPASLKWMGYAQSNKVTKPFDSSVSYASGYAVV